MHTMFTGAGSVVENISNCIEGHANLQDIKLYKCCDDIVHTRGVIEGAVTSASVWTFTWSSQMYGEGMNMVESCYNRSQGTAENSPLFPIPHALYQMFTVTSCTFAVERL